MVEPRKLAAAHYVTFLAAFVVALPLWPQAPVEGVLGGSEELLHISFERKIPILARTGPVTPEVETETSGPAEAAQPALEGNFSYIAGWVKCVGGAQDPHKSRDSGTVKTKAWGTCVYIPNSATGANRKPRQQDLTWTLYLGVSSGRAWARAEFPDRGYFAFWDPDSGGGGHKRTPGSASTAFT